MAVLLSYAISGERTLEEFYESAHPFVALFGREHLLHSSTLSRFLAALHQATVEALRTVFLEDLLARPLEQEEKTGGLWDRQGNQWLILLDSPAFIRQRDFQSFVSKKARALNEPVRLLERNP